MNNKSYSKEEIANKTRLYLEGINNIENRDVPTVLTEAAQANIMKFASNVMKPYNEGRLKDDVASAISVGEKIYHNEHPERTTTSADLTRTAEMKTISAPTLALVKKEEIPLAPSKKVGFINIAILLYGVLNIGIILAIAIMK